MTLKIVSVSVRYLFYKPMDEKIKIWTIHVNKREESIVRLANRVAV